MNTPLSVTGKANALLYLGMQYPGRLLLQMLRTIMRWYDKAALGKNAET